MAELQLTTHKAPKKNRTPIEITKKDWISLLIGFFLAMAVPYGNMAPFGLSYLAQERRLSWKAVFSLIAISIGSIIACDRLEYVKYISAGLIYMAVLFVLESDVRMNGFTAGLMAGGSVFLTGLVTIFWTGFSFSQIFLLLCETVAVVAGALVIEKSRRLFENGQILHENIGSEEKLSIGTVVVLAILSLREIYIGSQFSVMNMVATICLLMVSSGCGLGYSTGAGVVLGLACGIGSDDFLPILGAFSFCGFLSGLFARFGKGGVIAGVVLANAMLIVYTNGAMESVLSLYEIMAASVCFSFVKQSLIGRLGEVVCLGADEKAGIAKMREKFKARLAAVALSFEEMSKTLERLSEKKEKENKADLATFFDMAADKICRKCRKSSVCWNKEFDFTYQSLFKLMKTLDEKGVVNIDDADERFRVRCLELPHLIAEINHQLELHQVKRVWQSRLDESRVLVGEQLLGMSDILGEISSEIESDIRFDNISEWDIRRQLENKDIKIRELRVFREQDSRCRIELDVNVNFWTEKYKMEIRRIMKNVLGGEICIKEKYADNGKSVVLEIAEAEKYRVETDFAEKAASEKNGDNYRFSHISGGKYVIALSDGMGTGSRAARESEAMLELLDSFLRAGFDSSMAVKFINSIMLLKSNDDAFVTIDICIIDLYTGEAEFIKTGAEPSFIMQGHGVDTVKAASLPVGIIADMEVESCKKTIDDGALIVMVTDGVETKEGGSMWVSDFIEETCRRSDGHNIADKILSRAIENKNGEVNDDMTVLSVRLKAVG